MTFAITPASGFPPQASDEFPNYLQWQQDGVDLGEPNIDTVDLTGDISATRGTGENANKLTIAVASNPSGGAATSAEELVLSLAGATVGAFNGVVFSDWTGTVLHASADATWNETTNVIDLVQPGLYEVSIQGRVAPDSAPWPAQTSDPTYYGSEVAAGSVAGALTRSLYGLTMASAAWSTTDIQFTQWYDKYVVNAAALPATIGPTLYANAYNNESVGAIFSAVVTVRRIGDAA